MAFNRFDHSVLGELRPRFKLKINVTAEKALEQLSEKAKADTTVVAVKANRYVFLKIPQAQQHYWSPELSVRMEEEEFTDYTTVYCLLGPRQSIWLLFAFFYGFIACFSVIGGIFGLVKYQLSNNANWLWIIPIGVVLILSLFVVSKLGQNKGRDQMLHLVSFVYHSLDEVSEVSRLDR